MSKHWTLSVALSVLVAGCSIPGIPGMPGIPQFAQQSQGKNLSAQKQRSSLAHKQDPSITQRLVSAVMPGKSNQVSKSRSTKKVPVPKHDPISLGYDSGPPNAELYLSMAKLSDQGGKVEHARMMYQRALSTDQNNVEALLGLARLEDREGCLDEAIRYYQQAVAVEPKKATAVNDLALCYARRGDLQISQQLLLQATQLDPEKKLYRNNIAKVLTELNRVDDACVQLAAVYSPAIVNYNMGVLLHQRGRSEEAVKFVAMAKQMDPEMEQANILLSQLTRAMPQYAKQKPASNDHILPTPTDPPAQAALGQAHPVYPTTSTPDARPGYQSIPAETARVPVGNSPVSLPPIR